MDNWGSKKGFNTNSGILYIFQGKSNLGSRPQIPAAYCYEPRYMNQLNKKKTLEYMRNGKRNPKYGSRELTTSGLKIQGGEITNPDVNTI